MLDLRDKKDLILTEYNSDKKLGFKYKFKIDPTLFDYGFIKISKREIDFGIHPGDRNMIKEIDFWDCTDITKNNEFGRESIRGDIRLVKYDKDNNKCIEKTYQGGVVYVTAGENGLVEVDAWDEQKKIFEKRMRPNGDSDIHIGLSDEMIKELRHFFYTTSLRSRFVRKQKCIEFMDCIVIYYVIDGKSYLDLEIYDVSRFSSDSIEIEGYDVPNDLCKEVEMLFQSQNVKTIIKEKNKRGVYWNSPSDWLLPDTSVLKYVNNAVYMLKGVDNSTNEDVLKLGYICDENVNLYSLVKNVDNESMKIEKVRYSELVDAGEFQPEFILKSVCSVTDMSFKTIFNELLRNDDVYVYIGNSSSKLQYEYLNKENNSFREIPTSKDVDINELEKKYPEYQDFLNAVKEKLVIYHKCIVQNKPIDKEIPMTRATDLVEPSIEKERAKKTCFALYMWYGKKEQSCFENNVYIGIVGVDRDNSKNENSVWNRVFEQEQKNGIAAENNVTIERYKYIGVDMDHYPKRRSEFLQTIEMQCINNLSSLFSYNEISLKSRKEDIINPLWEGLHVNNYDVKINLLNKDKRYHNN